jgi:WD40 repeat protein
MVSMSSAKDKDGGRIIGSMDLTAGDATQILSMDTQNKAVEKLRQLSNITLTYFILPGPIDYFSGFVGDYFKIFDKVKTYYYKSDDGKVIPAGPEADAVSDLGPDGSVIYVDIQNNSDVSTSKRVLTKYDLSTGKRTALFELPDIEMNELTLSMSPDGKKAAFYLRSSDGLFVRVYDLKGKILFHKRDIKPYIPGYTELMWDYQRVQWINDDTFIYENKAADRDSYDIREVNLKTGKDRTVIKDAFQPVTLPNKNLIAAKIYKPDKEKDPSTIGIFENGTKVSEFIEGESRVFDFVFSSDGKLYMNCRNHKIYCYDPSAKKLELISDGLIRGMSKNRKKLYFIKDFDAIMPEY